MIKSKGFQSVFVRRHSPALAHLSYTEQWQARDRQVIKKSRIKEMEGRERGKKDGISCEMNI